MSTREQDTWSLARQETSAYCFDEAFLLFNPLRAVCVSSSTAYSTTFPPTLVSLLLPLQKVSKRVSSSRAPHQDVPGPATSITWHGGPLNKTEPPLNRTIDRRPCRLRIPSANLHSSCQRIIKHSRPVGQLSYGPKPLLVCRHLIGRRG